DDVLRPPLIVLGRRPAEIDDVVEAARLFPVAVADIDLRFKAVLWPVCFLIFSVKINSAIGIRLGHHIHLQLEILKRFRIPDVVEVTALAVSNEGAVFYLPGAWMFGGRFPPVESLPVKDLDEAVL